MSSVASLLAMTILAACMSAPFVAGGLFSHDLLETAPWATIALSQPVGSKPVATQPIGLAAR